MSANNVDLLSIPRPDGEELRVQLCTFKGRTFVGIRIWFPVEGGEMRPGRQGVTIPLHALGDVRQALTQAEALAEREGLTRKAAHAGLPQ